MYYRSVKCPMDYFNLCIRTDGLRYCSCIDNVITRQCLQTRLHLKESYKVSLLHKRYLLNNHELEVFKSLTYICSYSINFQDILSCLMERNHLNQVALIPLGYTILDFRFVLFKLCVTSLKTLAVQYHSPHSSYRQIAIHSFKVSCAVSIDVQTLWGSQVYDLQEEKDARAHTPSLQLLPTHLQANDCFITIPIYQKTST